MNPTAVFLSVFGAALGYAVDDMHGASIGLALTTGFVLGSSFLQYCRDRF